MNKGTQPIVARLLSLQAAARFAPRGARIISEAGERNALAQLLRAANETVLGRSLQFESAAGPSLTLDVAGRRVLRLTAANGLPGAELCLGIEVLEDEHKDTLIKLLQGVAVPRHELRVTSGPIGRGGEEVSVGLPVALLADLLLIELNPVGPEEPEPEAEVHAPVAQADLPDLPQTGGRLGRFARNLGPALVAWLIVGGEEDGQTDGSEEMVSHLQGFLDDEIEALGRQLDMISTAPGPVSITLGATLVEGHSIVCARADGAYLLGVIEGDCTAVLSGAWNTAWR